VIEYQVAEQGYFWHVSIIEELLSRAAAGHAAFELREPDLDRGEESQER